MNIKTIASSSSGCCYLIESEGEQLLIECGVSFNSILKALEFNLTRTVGCLISHEHKDHCLAIKNLARSTIPILCPHELAKKSGVAIYNALHAGTVFQCGSKFSVVPVLLEHDVKCFGFVIKSGDSILFYATDTGEVSYNIKGLTHLMIEANYSFDNLFKSTVHKSVVARVSENHLSITEAIDFALRHKDTLQEVHLLHLSDAHSDEKRFKNLAQESLGVPVYVAKKGKL